MRYSDGFGKRSSKILLGTAYFGDSISKEDAFAIMDKYFEMGGCHIDTARMYAEGRAETVIGEWLKDRKPEEIFISTKGGFPNADKPNVSRLSDADIRYDIENSLLALQLDCVDFYWLHRDDEKLPVCQIIDTLNNLVKEGKIKKFGASNWSAWRIEEANRYARENELYGFSASQIRFSPAIIAPSGNADRTLVDMDKESFSYYAKNNMPVAAYASQAKGFFSKMAKSGESGLSQKSKERYMCAENLDTFEIIKELATKYDCSVASIVCGSLCSISSPDVFPIIGGSCVGQIEDSMRGADIALNANEIKKVFSNLM
ncbi:MAG: aldo/keto reductase [Ruminococcaceae bacterium]|nr:aldo/keto reductase [Oscillospiraceae bacterium]